jgi:hypothetical protein
MNTHMHSNFMNISERLDHLNLKIHKVDHLVINKTSPSTKK